MSRKINWAKQQGTHWGNTGNLFPSTNTFPP